MQECWELLILTHSQRLENTSTLFLAQHVGREFLQGELAPQPGEMVPFPMAVMARGANQTIMQRGRKQSEAKPWGVQLSAALLCLLLMSRVLMRAVCASSHSGVRREAQRKEKTKLGGE